MHTKTRVINKFYLLLEKLIMIFFENKFILNCRPITDNQILTQLKP